MTAKEINVLLNTLTSLSDGIYDVSDIEFIEVDTYNASHILKQFIAENPNAVIASAYETDCTLLLASTPPKFKGNMHGSGFNYGSTNILTDCPKSILILAQND